MRFTFPKKERLKRQKIIKRIFNEGKSITVFPLRLHYIETPLSEAVALQAGFSVSKRSFKHAVRRNRIKRLMWETYRLNKSIVFNKGATKQYAFMFLYIGRKLPDFHALEANMRSILEAFKTKESLE